MTRLATGVEFVIKLYFKILNIRYCIEGTGLRRYRWCKQFEWQEDDK